MEKETALTSAKPVIGQKYIVQGGDTITEIAFQAYGDARRYSELAMHNQTIPGFNPARLIPGMEIDVPEPDYLPMPRGVGGMRGGVGRSFSVQVISRSESVSADRFQQGRDA